MSKLSKDTFAALVCIVLAFIVYVWIIPTQISIPSYFAAGGTNPRTIPQLSTILVLIMAVMMEIRCFRKDPKCFVCMVQEIKTVLQKKEGMGSFFNVMGVFLLSAVYYLGYCSAGFFLTTLILFPIYAAALGCRKIVRIIITDIVLTFSVYYFFAVFMQCYLPGWAPF